MSHIFISYNQVDSDFSEILENTLKKSNFKVWTDVSGLRGGEDWRKGIDEAIKKAFALIVVITPDSKASEYVTYEWAFAWGAGVKVIPLLLKPTQLHPRLDSLQYLDFTNHRARPWNSLIELLREAESVEPIPEKVTRKVNIEDEKNRNAYERMKEALLDENWSYRSLDRLAIKGGVSEDEAIEILRYDPDIIFSKTKSGRKIAKLKNK
jgi:hypothetical protein